MSIVKKREKLNNSALGAHSTKANLIGTGGSMID